MGKNNIEIKTCSWEEVNAKVHTWWIKAAGNRFLPRDKAGRVLSQRAINANVHRILKENGWTPAKMRAMTRANKGAA